MAQTVKLIVGLGNAGTQYQHNRHNVGFMANDLIVTQLNASAEADAHHSVLYSTQLNSVRVVIAYPQTLMNGSGRAVQALMAYYKIAVADVLVICDDFYVFYVYIPDSMGSLAAIH